MESSFLTAVFLPSALFIIMLGMGLSLIVEDFKRVVFYPKSVFIALSNQLVFLPLIAFLIAVMFNLTPELQVGIMLIAACPGGPTSNLIAHLSKGDTALSITLTAISSIITVFTIPLIVNFSMEYFLNQGKFITLDIPTTIIQILVITLVPVSIGMYIKAKKPSFAVIMEKPVKIASAIFLFLIILGVILKERENFLSFFQQAGLSALALNFITMVFGFYSAKLFKLKKAQSITISIESGIQNGTLGIFIASSMIQNSAIAITPAVYSLIMFLTGLSAAYFFSRQKERVIA